MSGWEERVSLNSRIDRFASKLGDTMNKLLDMCSDRNIKTKLGWQMSSTRSALTELGRSVRDELKTDSDLRRLEDKRKSAGEKVEKTIKAMEDMAKGILDLIQRNGKLKGMKSDATRLRDQVKDLKKEHTGIEAVLDTFKVAEKPVEVKPAVRAVNFTPELYLQYKRSFVLEISGPLGMYAGVVVRHVAGKNYGGHMQAVEEAEQNQNYAKTKFKELVAEFKIENGGELDFSIKRNTTSSPASAAPQAWQAPKYYRFDQFELQQGIGFTLPGEGAKARVRYTHRDFSGRFRIEVYMHQDRNSMASGLKSGTLAQRPIKVIEFDAVFATKLELITDVEGELGETKYFRYKKAGNFALTKRKDLEETHDLEQSHFGTKQRNEKIIEVGNRFAKEFPGKQVWINDMNLPWGGVFKPNQILTKGHQSHKTGNDADISYGKLTMQATGEVLRNQRLLLDQIIQDVFAKEHYWFHGGPDNWHWHVTTGGSTSKRTSMIEGFAEYWLDHEKIKANKIKMIEEIKRDGFYWAVYNLLKEKNVYLQLSLT